jgi:hypothetical protein
LEDGFSKCPLNQDGKVRSKTDNLNDYFYLSEFYIGNPPQKLRAIFDTGSTETLILKGYNSSLSSSAFETEKVVNVTFGAGNVHGHISHEHIWLGGCNDA